jgi:hypothetical protein
MLTHNGIDLAPRLRIMKDLQDILLLLFSADFHDKECRVEERESGNFVMVL